MTNFFIGALKSIYFLCVTMIDGVCNKNIWSRGCVLLWAYYTLLTVILILLPKQNLLPFLIHKIFTNDTGYTIAKWLFLNVQRKHQLVLVPIPFLFWIFLVGLVKYVKKAKLERAIRHLGIKTATGLEPSVKAVLCIDENRTKISVQAIGIDIAQFTAKKGALESSLNKVVQDIRVSQNSKQIFEIIISDRELPKLIRFDSVANKLRQPYTFLVGESNNEFIIGNLQELHHMLIAGSTGGGKSVFFKQALIGLLKSSEHLQLYLIDLKRGVEMKMFESLSNVYVAKSSVEAIHCLKMIEQEMARRFDILEKKGFTEIVPSRDKLDRIVIGIDEASVLFTVERGLQNNKHLAHEARELTDKLTKLGRAAGIHVILATQKVTKETIDTRVQTNIHAKICFRVNTAASSMTVLGNGKAAELPEIRGRAIWSVGSKDIEVQVPNLAHEEAKEEVELLSQKFNEGSGTNYQSLLITNQVAEEDSSGFIKVAEKIHSREFKKAKS